MALTSSVGDAIRAAIDSRKDPVWVFDLDRECMVFGNAAACDFWRAKTVEELVSRNYKDMSSATRSRLEAVRAALDNGETVHEQWTLYPASESPKTVEMRAERVDLSDGRLAILFSIERAGQSPMDALRGVEAVRHTTVLITLFDRDGTRALFANPAALRSYGPGATWQGLWVSRFVDEEAGRRVLQEVQAGGTVSLEARMRTRAGVRWHGLDARMTVDPATGDPAILVNEKDVQDAKNAEADLREARDELEHRVMLRTTELATSRDFVSTVLNTLDAWVVVVDPDGRIRWANRLATSRLGDRLIGRTVESVVGLPHEFDGVGAQIEHDERLVHWTVTTLDHPSHQVVLTGVDITERRALQLQLQLNDRLTSLGTLAAGMAHELNNPFAVIRANLEVLRDELAERDRADSLLATVNDSLAGMERAARIVADLRSFTRVEEEARPVELRGLVESVVGLAAGALRDLEVKVELAQGLHVNGVEGLLTQVLLNLLINAAQSIDGPPGTVRVSAAREGARVCIAVEDDGPGIDPELARRAFDPFFTTKRVGDGTGLGLYVCQRIVLGHDGEIRFVTVDRGARVEVTLPVATPQPLRETWLASADRAFSSRILVVDDDRAVLRAMKRLLRDHEVDLASSGDEAIMMLLEVGRDPDRPGYDIVLCDLMMPGMSGDALFAQVQREAPTVAGRFVFMSGGLPYRSSIAEFLASVPNRFIQKPVDRRALDKALREVGSPDGR